MNVMISLPDQADAAMKDPGSVRLLPQVLKCSVGSAQAHGRKTSGCCMTLVGPIHHSPSARQTWCILAVPLPVSVPFPVPVPEAVFALVTASSCAVTSRFFDLRISQWSEDPLQKFHLSKHAVRGSPGWLGIKLIIGGSDTICGANRLWQNALKSEVKCFLPTAKSHSRA